LAKKSVRRALLDRIIIGLGKTDIPDVGDGRVAVYVLNPDIRGSQKLTVCDATTWPAFDRLYVQHDERMLGRLGVSLSSLVLFWMCRFLAYTEKDVVFGYIFASDDRSRFCMRTLAFDYKLAIDLFGLSVAGLEEVSISRSLLMEMLNVCVGLISTGTGVLFDIVHSQAVDPGVEQTFPSGGGLA
jgi:hypothetical protein